MGDSGEWQVVGRKERTTERLSPSRTQGRSSGNHQATRKAPTLGLSPKEQYGACRPPLIAVGYHFTRPPALLHGERVRCARGSPHLHVNPRSPRPTSVFFFFLCRYSRAAV